MDAALVARYYYFYYQFYQIGTGGFHKKAEPVGCVTQSQREPIRIKQGRTLLNFKSKKKPTPGRTEPAGWPGTTLSGPTWRGQLWGKL